MTNEYRSLKDRVYDYLTDLIDDGALGADRMISAQRDCGALQNSLRGVHWSSDNAKFLVW